MPERAPIPLFDRLRPPVPPFHFRGSIWGELDFYGGQGAPVHERVLVTFQGCAVESFKIRLLQKLPLARSQNTLVVYEEIRFLLVACLQPSQLVV